MSGKDNRIKYNLLSGFAYQIILIALSFLLPRLYLENFGSEVNGILSTIKQIFVYMSLLEAGVGLATMQALYKPVAQQDHAEQCVTVDGCGHNIGLYHGDQQDES